MKYDYFIYESCPRGCWADCARLDATNEKDALIQATVSWGALSKHDQDRRDEFGLYRVPHGFNWEDDEADPLEGADLVKDFAN